MIKKFMIIAILTLFMISAVSASDVDESISSCDIDDAVSIDCAESKIQEFVEANQPDFEEIEIDDVVVKDVISEESTPINNQEYNDSYIINSENFNEIENYQYNDTYIDVLICDDFDNDTDFDLNNSIVSYFIFNVFFKDLDIFTSTNIGSNFKIIVFGSALSKFKEINKFKVLTHDDLIFYNNYYHILTHDVGKNVVFLSDKLHTKFAFSINNSIVGSADVFMQYFLTSNFSNFNSFSLSSFQTFSNFVQIFKNINYFEYSFFPHVTIE